jgi:protein-tyrosine phosphatase
VRRTAELQIQLQREGIDLTVLPGGEMNLGTHLLDAAPELIVSYAMAGKFALVDMWAERIPDHFEPAVRRLQSLGLTVILAHPERMRAVQDDWELAKYFAEVGVLLQGNLQCFSDAAHTATRRTADRFLRSDRYFMLGTDLHGRESLPRRLAGFNRLQSELGPQVFDELTIGNPSKLLNGCS